VELWFAGDGPIHRVSPVEFKRGKEKESDVDRVQLCAQALCLEEMLDTTIEQGQLYYLQEHRRTDVKLDGELRNLTVTLIDRARAILASKITPAAEYKKHTCDRCSMLDLCMPKSAGKDHKDVSRFVQNQLRIVKNTCKIEDGSTDEEQA
jgi:CRISPR-associated exonuclease Cas4